MNTLNQPRASRGSASNCRRNTRISASNALPTPWLLGTLIIVQALAACDGSSTPHKSRSSTGDAPDLPDRTVSFAEHGHGYFWGAIAGAETFIGEALITVDGQVRINVRNSSGGELDQEVSSLFVGAIDVVEDDQAVGSGVIIGLSCSLPEPGPFCSEAAVAEIALNMPRRHHLQGEIRLQVGDFVEIWQLNVDRSGSYYNSFAHPLAAGTFVEQRAPFAQTGDVILTTDGAGNLFFQGAESGCTGNGVLTPHGDGRYAVWDVEMTIGNCNATYDYLNREFTGLATTLPSDPWGFYGTGLLMFLSTPEQSGQRAALTMYSVCID